MPICKLNGLASLIAADTLAIAMDKGRPIRMDMVISQLFEHLASTQVQEVWQLRWRFVPHMDDAASRHADVTDWAEDTAHYPQTGEAAVSEATRLAEADRIASLLLADFLRVAKRQTGSWLLEVEIGSGGGPAREVPIMVLGVPLGLAAHYAGVSDAFEESYGNILLFPAGIEALGMSCSIAEGMLKRLDGCDLSLNTATGEWTLWNQSQVLAQDRVNLRALADILH